MKSLQTDCLKQADKALADKDIAVKERIIDTAMSLFYQLGIKSISVSDIANQMTIAKKTFYNHFQSKDELVVTVIEKILAENKISLLNFKKQSADIIEEAFLGWSAVRCFFMQVNGQLFFQVKKYYPDVFKMVTVFKDDFLYNHFKRNIENGITAGFYRHNISPDVIARYLLNGILTTSVEAGLYKVELSSAEIEKELFFYNLHAIATDEGITLMNKYSYKYL